MCPGLTLKSWWSFEMVIWSWHPRCVFREQWQETTNVWDPQCYPILSQIVVLFEIKHTNRFKKGLVIYFQPPLHLCELGLVYSNPKKIKPPFAIILKSSFIVSHFFGLLYGSQWITHLTGSTTMSSTVPAGSRQGEHGQGESFCHGPRHGLCCVGLRSTPEIYPAWWILEITPTMMSSVAKLFPSPIEKTEALLQGQQVQTPSRP